MDTACDRQMAKRSRRSTPCLTADNQMTRKPNLALNAEIEMEIPIWAEV
jgi:hypothetical protein